ncbi:MAG: single-stranded DNA-binding protein [Treponema sp.]|jgi:single-strand DNA-binding protein|nr:single-stranded DNA-binding protein [Treponema sp.]
MNNLNSILIEGNLVRDPMLRSTPKGTQVCMMSLASNRYYKQDTGFEKEVSFFDVETWARLAEACYAKGKKGRGVRVVGRLKQDRWTGTDGKTHSKVAIVAEHVEFRPEFKKDSKSAAQENTANPEVPFDDYSGEETAEAVLEPIESKLEPVF